MLQHGDSETNARQVIRDRRADDAGTNHQDRSVVSTIWFRHQWTISTSRNLDPLNLDARTSAVNGGLGLFPLGVHRERYGVLMLWRWFAVVIVILAVAGIWHVTIPDRPVAAIVDAETLGCATPYPIGPLQTTSTATVPDDFVPVAAVTCDPFVSDNVAADRTVSFSAHRWEGDFSRAVEMLNRSSAHKTWFPEGCGDNYSLAVLDQFWLVDDRGRATRPGYPSDSCGLPKPGGLAAIKELTPVGSTEHRIALSDDQIYELSHCRPAYRPATTGTAALASLSAGSVFCRFSATEFVGTSSTTETFDGLPPAPDCDAVATEVASTIYVDRPTNEERLLNVELDGCRRVIADGYAPMQASDELLVSFR